MNLEKKLLRRASARPWHIVKNGGPKMSAIMSADGVLIAGSLICDQQTKQDVADHELIVYAVNSMKGTK